MITKTKLITCIAAVMLTVIISDLTLPRGEKSIYDTTVRLHILANSDSAEDQKLKLEVRDAIIENCGDEWTVDFTRFSFGRINCA